MSINNSIQMTHIGNNIEHLRITKRIKQQTMADSLEVSQQRWSQLIAKETWSVEMLNKVAKVLNMTITEIENYDPEKSIISKGDNNQFTIFIVNLNLNGVDDKTFDQLSMFIGQLREMNKKEV